MVEYLIEICRLTSTYINKKFTDENRKKIADQTFYQSILCKCSIT